MKKFLTVLLLTLAACGTTTPPATVDDAPVTSSKGAKSSCVNVKGVKDPENGGNIYYDKSHHLFNFIKLDPKQGDRGFCTLAEAKKAGFSKEAPEYFNDSAYNQIQCLNSESENGKCHEYIYGVYQSLRIYDKVCGPAAVSKAELANVYENHAKKAKNGMDVSKYSGATSAFISKYSCR